MPSIGINCPAGFMVYSVDPWLCVRGHPKVLHPPRKMGGKSKKKKKIKAEIPEHIPQIGLTFGCPKECKGTLGIECNIYNIKMNILIAP